MSLVAVLIIAGPESDRPADAGFPFPPPPLFGVLLTVNTTVYPGFDDGFCSLDEAINAANINGIDDTCNASASEAGATDGIEFAIGAGNINVTSALPVITAPLAINGSVDTGGGAQITRVVLHGAGNNTGITVGGAAAAGSSIRNLVLNNFSTAIYLATTSNVTVAGNFIGTNAAGTGTVPNGVGISLSGASATIGGLNGLTPGGPCTGDCNLISGNSAGQARGIEMRNSSSATIRGNFIGTDAAGMFLFPNGVGVSLDRSRATIGGTAPGAGNVISGSASSAISIETDIDMAQGTVIQGNFIGTNVTGTAAVPNLGNGIYAYFGNQDYPLIIGGSGDGATNVISGNGAAGIYLTGADYVSIHGNLIGTQADGVSPLPNADAGVRLGSSTHSNLIGGISPGEGNVIANNGADGVVVGINNYYNQVRGNSIHDNAGKGIYEPDNQADFTQIPTITGFGSVHGTACNNCIIDVYSDSADEGRIYEGTTTADGAGNWSYGGAMTGPNVTVTASSNESNPSQYSTSEFSAPMSVPTTPTPTPSPTSTPTPTPSATNAPTPTPTPIGGSPAPTPTPTPTPTGGPTGSPTPTPTGSPLTGALWGDDDCSVAVAATDSLKKLQDIAALPYQVEPGCPAFGDQVTVAPAGSIQVLWGDTDCDDDVDAVDALQILRQIAGLPPNQVQPCPEIGAPVLLG